MSAYVVNDETITVIAGGLVEYGIECRGVQFDTMQLIFVNERIKPIGQWLLDQNYRSVNYRYREENEVPEFDPVRVGSVDAGTLLGCIECYEYQACETDDYETSEIHLALVRLKDAMLKRFIQVQGYEIPWGYESED